MEYKNYLSAFLRGYDYTIIAYCDSPENTGPFTKELQIVLSSIPKNFLVVLVNDGFSTASEAALEKLKPIGPRIDLYQISAEQPIGKQAAFLKSLLHLQIVKCDHFILMEANGDDDPRAIPYLLDQPERDVLFVDKGPKANNLFFWFIYRFHQFFFWLITSKEINFDHYSLINRKALDSLLRTPFLHYTTALHFRPLKLGEIRFEHANRGFVPECRHLFHNSYGSLLECGENLINFFIKFSLILAFLFFSGLVYIGAAKLFAEVTMAHWLPYVLIALLNALIFTIGFFALGVMVLNRSKSAIHQFAVLDHPHPTLSPSKRVPTHINDPVNLN